MRGRPAQAWTASPRARCTSTPHQLPVCEAGGVFASMQQARRDLAAPQQPGQVLQADASPAGVAGPGGRALAGGGEFVHALAELCEPRFAPCRARRRAPPYILGDARLRGAAAYLHSAVCRASITRP